MYEQLIVYKGRTNVVPISLGINVSGDTITSQIREKADPTSALIATWSVSFATDGTDGELILTLDNAVTSTIVQSKGYMDLKRVSSGEPLPVFENPLEVIFKNTVTS